MQVQRALSPIGFAAFLPSNVAGHHAWSVLRVSSFHIDLRACPDRPNPGAAIMAQRRRFTQNKRQAARSPVQDTRTLRKLPVAVQRAPVVYGKPFILVEDAEKNTFIFKAGEWVQHPESIAECRQTCQVKELPQRVNGRIRYEVRAPENRTA